MKIGLLGGSFNPPHRGHLALARTVLNLGLAERVCLVPAAIPPHKAAPSQADAPTRLAMTRLLAGEDDRILVDDLELHRQGKSYTIDTLRELYAAHPGNAYRLIIGSDLAKTFATWRDYGEILRLAPPLVAERPDSPFRAGDGDGGRGGADYPGLPPEAVRILEAGRFDMPPEDVSSTLVRELLDGGADDARLLPYLTPSVLAFIREHGLYAPTQHA